MERKLVRLLVVSCALASLLVAGAAHTAMRTPASATHVPEAGQTRLSTASIW